MDLTAFLKRQLPVLGLFAVLVPYWTLLLHRAVCIEGGTVIGFPWPFYDQCYGPPLPGGGQVVDPAHFEPVLMVVDLVVWYLVSFGTVYLLRRMMKR